MSVEVQSGSNPGPEVSTTMLGGVVLATPTVFKNRFEGSQERTVKTGLGLTWADAKSDTRKTRSKRVTIIL